MAYEYDIFLSYRRDPESRQWLVEHFQPLLKHYVELKLGREVFVFRDDQDIEAGGTWPVQLGVALGNSRTLVALWNSMYFHSDWCSRELSAMLAREREEKFRTPERPKGLIFPVVVYDCEPLPPVLAPLQYVAMHREYLLRMERSSATAERLERKIAKELAPGVASAVNAAPKWRKKWPLRTAARFLAAVRRKGPPRQTQLPRHSR